MQNLPGRGRERGVLLLGYLSLDFDFGEMLKVAGRRPHPPEPSHVTPCTAPQSRGGGAPAAASSSVLSRARKPLRCSLSPSEPPMASATTGTRSRRAWLTLLRHTGLGAVEVFRPSSLSPTTHLRRHLYARMCVCACACACRYKAERGLTGPRFQAPRDTHWNATPRHRPPPAWACLCEMRTRGSLWGLSNFKHLCF